MRKDMIAYVLAYLLILFAFVAVGYTLYWICKRPGYPKLGKGSLVGCFILFVTLILCMVFEDQLFFKRDAEELLIEQNIKLTDNFALLKNESMSAVGDYYHTFTLQIADRDRQKIIRQITSSPGFSFKKDETWVDDSLFQTPNRYIGKRVVRNYATEQFL
jgi:hypothetical protein